MQKNILKKIATVLVAFLISFSTFSVSAKEKENTKEYQGTISKEKLKETLKENEYALYDEETDTTTIINKDDEAPVMMFRSSNGVDAGATLSGGEPELHWSKDSSYNAIGPFYEYSVNGEVGYCLEPMVSSVITGGASATDLNNLNTLRIMYDGSYNFKPSQTMKKNITLIANYGYQYPGHQTKAYRWATQIMIWEALGWVMDNYGDAGKPINEINEINTLLKAHNTTTKWNGKTYNVKIGDTLDLSDSVISKFDVAPETKGVKVIKKEGNIFKVKIIDKSPLVILEKKKGLKKGISFVYSNGDTQTVASFKYDDPITSVARFNVQSEGTLKIAKVDTKGTKVPNVKFKVWYSSNPDKTWEYITDESGETRVSTWQANKELSIQEVEVPNYLVLDPTIKKVTLKVNELTTVTFTNDIKSSLRIYKIDKDTDKPLPNTKFNILNENKELVKSITTDYKGMAEANYLTEGKYFIEEVEVPKPYVINPNNKIQEITIKNNQDNYEVVFKNEIKKVDFVLYKQNSKNKQLLNGAIYEFSVIDNNGTKTSLGRFITGGLIIPSNTNITLYSDDTLTTKVGTYKPINTEVIIEDLKPGNYYTEINNKTIKYTVIKGGISLNALPEGSKLFYKEIKAPIGYTLDTKEYEANLIGEHNELISNYRTNDIIGLPPAGETNLPILTLISIITTTMFAVVGIAYYLVSKDKK